MFNSNREDLSINTILGPGSSIKGDVETAGFTRIDASLHGNLTAKGRIVVGEKARIKGNISGTAVTIGGVICGNVVAEERLVILSTGLVLGDIITRRIQADEGCLVHGRVTVCDTDAAWDKAMRDSQDSLGLRSALSGFTERHNG